MNDITSTVTPKITTAQKFEALRHFFSLHIDKLLIMESKFQANSKNLLSVKEYNSLSEEEITKRKNNNFKVQQNLIYEISYTLNQIKNSPMASTLLMGILNHIIEFIPTPTLEHPHNTKHQIKNISPQENTPTINFLTLSISLLQTEYKEGWFGNSITSLYNEVLNEMKDIIKIYPATNLSFLEVMVMYLRDYSMSEMSSTDDFYIREHLETMYDSINVKKVKECGRIFSQEDIENLSLSQLQKTIRNYNETVDSYMDSMQHIKFILCKLFLINLWEAIVEIISVKYNLAKNNLIGKDKKDEVTTNNITEASIIQKIKAKVLRDVFYNRMENNNMYLFRPERFNGSYFLELQRYIIEVITNSVELMFS